MNTNSRTITILFTDLENSTPLWESHPERMHEAAARHDFLIQEAIEANRGQVVKTTGDGFHAVFHSAVDGVLAALAGQQAIIREEWPSEIGQFRVRMGLHTGESRLRDGDYYGSEVNRAARVMGLAHGGQILLSGPTAALIRTATPSHFSLLDLGEHRLKGLKGAEQLFQIQHPSLPGEFPALKSLSVLPNNLPARLSTFIGRQKELSEIKRLLKESRLVTLLGPGGTGKTRLMLEAAEELVADFSEGVWVVELAPLTDPNLIADRINAALKVPDQPDKPALETLVDYLRHKELLLLLDNIEHLVQKCAELVEHLLAHCPRLVILITSREALFISGEITLQIPSLSLPSGIAGAALDDIRSSEGVQLFVARTQEVRPGFELDRQNANVIAEIVRRLDGIPFALELAAARMRLFTVHQLADRLDDRFRLLTGGRRTALPRQQTLQAMIEWSWNLLSDKERLLLQRLSIFSGGWSLEAAQAVAGDDQLDEYDVLDLLDQLLNKSLVTVQYPPAGEARYGMLESIRQFGRDRLLESAEGTGPRDRHAAYFVAFAEEAGPHIAHSLMLPWLEKIRQELDNLRAVLKWTLEERPELALRIAGSLLYLEVNWLPPREAMSWLESAVEATRPLLENENSSVRISDFIQATLGLALAHAWLTNIQALHQYAEEGIQLSRRHNLPHYLVVGISNKHIANAFSIDPEGMQELEEAISIGRKLGLQRELALALLIYGVSLFAQSENETSVPFSEEFLKIVHQVDNPGLNAMVFALLAVVANFKGDRVEAKRYTLLVKENYETIGDRRGVLRSKSDLAHILRLEGHIDEAQAYYRQTILGWQEIGQPAAVAHQIECFAYIALARGQFARSAKLLGAAASARESLLAVSTDPLEIAAMSQAMEQLAEGMGEVEQEKVMAEGRLLSLDDAVQVALS